MSETGALPESWVEARIEDIAQPSGTWSPKASTADEVWYVDIEALDNAQQVIASPKRLKTAEAPSRARVAIQAGDVLFSLVRPYLKNIAVVPESLDGQVASTAYCAVRPGAGIESKYLYYALVRDTFIKSVVTYGNSPPSGHDDEFLRMALPVAPLAEQRRIVAAIEEQFTRLDAGVAALKRAQAALKRYRAAVLKAAVEGRLTEAWRAQHPDIRPASELLADILAERRAKWESDLRAKGKDPAKAKYEEPKSPQTEGLPELPQGWVWATVEQLAAPEPNAITDGPFGSNLKTEHYRSEGMRVIRLQNIGDGVFNDVKAYISPEHFATLGKHRVFAGDVVIAALGEKPPRSCIVPETFGPAIVKADCIRLHVSERACNRYVHWVLNADPTRQRTAKLLHGVGRPRLNLSEIKSIVVPLPSASEQLQVVAEVEQRLSVVDALEETVAANLKRAERLRQAILERAFTGRLVPQDPTDEPASALMERIRDKQHGGQAGSQTASSQDDGALSDEQNAPEAALPRQRPLWRG